LFIQSLVNARAVDVGFQPDGRVAMSYDLHLHGYSAERAAAFHTGLLERVRALPGVKAASLAKRIPLGGTVEIAGITLPDRPVDPDLRPPRAALNSVWPGFFETMGIPIVRGRALSSADLTATPLTAVVNETLAKQQWPADDPIGQRFSINGTKGPFVEVVGVARDTIVDELNEAPFQAAYLPAGNIRDEVALLAWVDGEPGAALRMLERQIRELDGSVAVFAPQTLAAHIADRMDGERGLSRILSVTGVIALALASVGLYGVMAYTVARRTREIGVRVALGAQPRDVVRLFVAEAGWLAAIGLLVGLLPAVGVSALFASTLVGVRVADPIAIGSAVMVLGTVSLLAAFVPALRAVRVDPLVALRSE
jgi:predicted permease